MGGSGLTAIYTLYRFYILRTTTLGHTPPHNRAVSTHKAVYHPSDSSSLLGIDGVHERDEAAVAIRRGQSHRAQPWRRPQRGVQRVILGGADVLRRLRQQQQPVPRW